MNLNLLPIIYFIAHTCTFFACERTVKLHFVFLFLAITSFLQIETICEKHIIYVTA